MSNLLSDHYDYTTHQDCCCRPATPEDDGIRDCCRTRKEAAHEKAAQALEAALGRYMTGVEAIRWRDDVTAVLEGLIVAATVPGSRELDRPERCRLCGWTDGCKDDCPVNAIRALVEGA